jgi:hypothetical protein
LVNQLRRFPGPVIDREIRLAAHAPVFARYGAFQNLTRRTKVGVRQRYVKDRDGKAVPDDRSVAMHQLLGIPSPFAADVPPLGPLLNERFLLVGSLLETGHSTVAIGVDLASAETCALKIVKRHAGIDREGKDYADRLRHEWTVLEALNGRAGAPKPIAFWEVEDRALLVLENIQGENLLQYVHTQELRSASGQQQLLLLAVTLITRLEELHAAGIVHGDLSPANFMVDSSGTLRMIDFEVSCQAEAPSTQGAFGVRGYTAPARMAGAAPRREHDLYSLGAILYFLVTGTDLAVIPQYDRVLRAGDMLNSPWREILASLVHAAPESTDQVLAEARQTLLHVLDNSESSPALLPPSAWRGLMSRHASETSSDREDALRQVEDLGSSILQLADPNSGQPGLWTSRHFTTPGEQFRDLYMGDAGIAFGLLRIGLCTERVDLIEVAVDCAERLWEHKPAEEESLGGLFIGEAGVGLLFLTLADILRDPLWLDRAVRLSRRLGEASFDSPDLLHGAAGRGLFHLWVYEHSSAPEDLALAVAVGQHLANTCERTSLGPFWRIPEGYGDLEGGMYYGIAHGSAGVGLFLAELAKTQPNDGTISLLRDIGHSLVQAGRSRDDADDLDWPDAPEGAFRGGVWCHGSAGIALALVRIYQVLKEETYLAYAVRAAESALRRAHQIGPTQCHGIAGLLEVYLDLFAETRDQRHLDAAHGLGERLRTAFVTEGPTGPMICSERANVLTSEFMIGSSGAASALARLLEPKRFGHFLNSPRRAFRPRQRA